MEKSTVVIDNGSFTCKAGLAGQDAPSVEVRSIVGVPRMTFPGIRFQDHYVGDEAMKKRGILTLKHPIERGFVTNWDDMEKIWDYIFHDQLHVSPEDHSLLLTEHPWNSRKDREKMTERMLEAFKTPALYVAVPAVLGLYTSGQLTSIVIDSGHDSSLSIPVYEGHAIPSAVVSLEVAGHQLTWHLHKLLQDRDHSYVTNAEYELVREIKEKVCYVAFDFDKELQSTEPNPAHNLTYELPDGNIADIGKACFECPEGMFQPKLLRSTYDGIHENCCNSIKKCDHDIHTALSRNIVLSGDNTLFPGIVERFTKEVTGAAPPTWMIKVAALPQRKHSAWIGGSMLASLPTFQEMAIAKAEYDEFGPTIVHRKCF